MKWGRLNCAVDSEGNYLCPPGAALLGDADGASCPASWSNPLVLFLGVAAIGFAAFLGYEAGKGGEGTRYG